MLQDALKGLSEWTPCVHPLGYNVDNENIPQHLTTSPVLGMMKQPVSSAPGMPPPPVSSQYTPNVQQNGAPPPR